MRRFVICAFGSMWLGPMQPAGAQAPAANAGAVDEKALVDCALPPQVRKLDARTTTQMPGGVVRLPRAECLDRGGEPSARSLERGSARDASVVNAQKKLAALGFDPGPPDGIPGGRTSAAVRRFQTDRQLAVTGKLDDATMLELQK